MTATASRLIAIVILAVSGAAGCSNGVPLGPPSLATLASNPVAPSDTTPAATAPAPTTPTTTPTPTPTPAPVQKIAYTPDLQPIFNADCTSCHGGNRPAGNYSMSSYSNVMRAVRVGSASSALVIVTRSNGSMYRFFSGDRATKSAMVTQWVVTDGAAQSR
jgi:mono/diheme cytochrome c family protein